MLPVWLSDLRGAFWLLAAAVAARKARLPVPSTALWILSGTCSAGLAFSVAFYIHTTRTVFNRRPPFAIMPFWRHLMMTRPLEAVWRFLTAPLRVYPDFLLLGEVRTGTTSMAAHLRSIGCIGPFSAWILPLANDKESLYFAGHYFGLVHPGAYRMCFPLKFTMWLSEKWYGARPVIFDGCASHLTAPWAPQLTSAACPEATLLVIVRKPEEQHRSWWRLERNAILWGKSMGMGEDFLMKGYPPKSLLHAVSWSKTDEVEALYREGESAGEKVLGSTGGRGGLLAALLAPRIHERLLPFPGGQLLAFSRMGNYAQNIRRYLKFFKREQLVIAETRELAEPGGAAAVARRLAARSAALGALQAERDPPADVPRLNESALLPPDLEPSEEDLRQIARGYKEANEELGLLMGRKLDW